MGDTGWWVVAEGQVLHKQRPSDTQVTVLMVVGRRAGRAQGGGEEIGCPHGVKSQGGRSRSTRTQGHCQGLQLKAKVAGRPGMGMKWDGPAPLGRLLPWRCGTESCSWYLFS